MVRQITVSEPLLKLGLTLGEGCVWDSRTQKLYFVDIDGKKLYGYIPETGAVSERSFDYKLGSIALLEEGEGLVAAWDDGFCFIPPASMPFNGEGHAEIVKVNLPSITLSPGEKRFNEGAADPAGRFIAGTMGHEHGQFNGRMYSLTDKAGELSAPPFLDGVTCTNGMGWTPDTKTMYFSDSWIKEISVFDFDNATGTVSNRRPFSTISDTKYGWPDGLCMDKEGGVWTARWEAGKILRLLPDGSIDIEIDFPTAWNITCCIFGGKDLQDLYVTTANTDIEGPTGLDKPDGGHIFIVKGLGIEGVERHRYRGAIPQ